MAFEIIKGGLYDEDIPTPEGPYSEWTEEEKEEYHRYLWENPEKGTITYTIKNLNISAESVNTIINTLEAIKSAAQEEATATGYKSDWTITTAEELLSLMLRKKQ